MTLRAPDLSPFSTPELVRLPAVRSVVALIEDDPAVRRALERLLATMGFGVVSFASAEEFLARGRPLDFGCLLLDLRLPGMSGTELCQRLHNGGAHLPVILMSSEASPDAHVHSCLGSGVRFMTKPFDAETLWTALVAPGAPGGTRAAEGV